MLMMERKGLHKQSVVVICSVVFWWVGFACVPEEEIVTSDPDARLTFSQDTVLFDTLFSTVGSITKRFQLYNPNEKAVKVTSVELGKGQSSPYRVYLNGQVGTQFSDILLLGGDSLLILVEVNIDPQDQDLPFLVKDSLVFTANQNVQDLKLVAWGQDAYFLQGVSIKKDTVFTGKRPYVVYDSLWVEENATLRVKEGTRIYFNTDSKLVVEGRLQVSGAPDKQVIFRNDRLDGVYARGLGQWQGIYLNATSQHHQIDFAVIQNAEIGIAVEGADTDTVPDLTLTNTIIENMSGSGVLAVSADVEAYNVLINNCVVHLAAHVGGGFYRYRHCTFANDFTLFSREGTSLVFADTLLSKNPQRMHVVLQNNIIWGSRPDELYLLAEADKATTEVRTNLIRTTLENEYGELNILNQDPQFLNPPQQNYQLDSVSPAINQGVLTVIKKDLEGNERDTLPDLGSYEYKKK